MKVSIQHEYKPYSPKIKTPYMLYALNELSSNLETLLASKLHPD